MKMRIKANWECAKTSDVCTWVKKKMSVNTRLNDRILLHTAISLHFMAFFFVSLLLSLHCVDIFCFIVFFYLLFIQRFASVSFMISCIFFSASLFPFIAFLYSSYFFFVHIPSLFCIGYFFILLSGLFCVLLLLLLFVFSFSSSVFSLTLFRYFFPFYKFFLINCSFSRATSSSLYYPMFSVLLFSLSFRSPHHITFVIPSVLRIISFSSASILL